MTNDDCADDEICDFYRNIHYCLSKIDEKPCFDNDGDGFYVETSPKYIDICPISDSRPRDLDDNNPLVYPGARELCDGLDNNGDGCVDGTCPEDANCKKDTSLCEIIVIACWGAGDYQKYDNSACSAAELGVNICLDSKYTHGILVDGKIVKDSNPEGRCPNRLEEIPNYAPQDSDGIDRNCDGTIDNN